MGFKSVAVAIGTSDTEIFTCPTTQEGSLHGLVIGNVTTGASDVTLRLYKQATGVTTVLVVKSIPAKDAWAFPKPINMVAGDKVSASAGASATLVATGGFFQQSSAAIATIGFNPRGAWSSTAIYGVNDVASLSGSSYIAVNPNTNSSPPSADWMVLASKGDPGAAPPGAVDTDIWAATSTSVFVTPGALKDSQAWKNYDATGAVTATLDLNNGLYFKVGSAASSYDTITGNITLANPLNLKAGWAGSIRLKQDATGSRTISYGTNWKPLGGSAIALSTAAGTVDYIDWQVAADGASILYSVRKNQGA
jgi:hypothetical protein